MAKQKKEVDEGQKRVRISLYPTLQRSNSLAATSIMRIQRADIREKFALTVCKRAALLRDRKIDHIHYFTLSEMRGERTTRRAGRGRKTSNTTASLRRMQSRGASPRTCSPDERHEKGAAIRRLDAVRFPHGRRGTVGFAWEQRGQPLSIARPNRSLETERMVGNEPPQTASISRSTDSAVSRRGAAAQGENAGCRTVGGLQTMLDRQAEGKGGARPFAAQRNAAAAPHHH